MVDVDNVVLKVDILDGKPTEFGDSHSCVEEDVKGFVILAVHIIVPAELEEPLWLSAYTTIIKFFNLFHCFVKALLGYISEYLPPSWQQPTHRIGINFADTTDFTDESYHWHRRHLQIILYFLSEKSK